MFRFDEVEDFESHIRLSIPNYNGLCDIFRAFVYENAHKGGSVLDIGCSTGAFLSSLKPVDGVEYIGCDVLDIRPDRNKGAFTFVKEDLRVVLDHTPSCDVLLSMFTLQFLGRHIRKDVVEKMREMVSGGTTLLIAEKVYMPVQIETVMKREHVQQKRKVFSDVEILNKEALLAGSMHCVTDSEFMEELTYIGKPIQIWQSYNFKGFLVT